MLLAINSIPEKKQLGTQNNCTVSEMVIQGILMSP